MNDREHDPPTNPTAAPEAHQRVSVGEQDDRPTTPQPKFSAESLLAHDPGDTIEHRLALDPGALGSWDLGDTTLLTALPYDLAPPYTGRSEVIATLVEACEHSFRTGSCSFLVLMGEAGMGKSRTVTELGATVQKAHRRARVVVGRGAPTPYAAFSRLLAQRFHISPGLPAETARQRILDAVSALLTGSRAADVTHLLAYLAGIPFPDSPVITPLIEAPQQLESRLFIALRRFLAADAATAPLVLVLEDLEQCGEETINLLHYLASGLSEVPVVVIATAEPSLLAAYPDFGAGDLPATRIDLGRLSDDDTEALLQALCRPLAAVPTRLVEHARRLDGSPRALMELIRLLLESGVIVRAGARTWTIDPARLDATELPCTYEDLAGERLEVMPADQRRLLERAAVIGPVFWLDSVVALVRTAALTEDSAEGLSLGEIAGTETYARRAVALAIEHLIEHEWIARVDTSSMPGEPEYRFANPILHALVHDRTPAERRRADHKITAQWIELRPDGAHPARQEQVAYHLEQAGDRAAAAVAYRRAADAARAAFFNDRAIDLYQRALACLGTHDLAARMLLWHDLGSVYELKGAFDAAVDVFERMLRLAWLVAARTKAAVAFNKIGRVWRRKGDLKRALESLERAAELFEQTGDGRGIAGSLDDIGRVLLLLGRYDEAYAKISAALEWRDREGDSRSVAMSVSNLGTIQKARGQFDEAQRCYRQALELQRDIGDRWGMAASLDNLAALASERGDFQRARQGWLAALDEAEHIGALPLASAVLSNLAELAYGEGQLEDARRRATEALEIATDIDERRLQAESMITLALIEREQGDLDRARELAHRAHAVAAAAGLRESEARALVCLGDVFSASLYDADAAPPDPGDVPAAQDYYQRGIALYRALGNESRMARSLDRFGRYCIERGDITTGKDLLREALVLYSKLELPQVEAVEELLARL
ncbi:ATP-binding protein [Haliangium sp.]|uniref:ATP-binding protein n=1 Tax=Haliangium sp. TaxID=2663208 RepID=UPI003D09D9F9